jgi:hypothetical protein
VNNAARKGVASSPAVAPAAGGAALVVARAHPLLTKSKPARCDFITCWDNADVHTFAASFGWPLASNVKMFGRALLLSTVESLTPLMAHHGQSHASVAHTEGELCVAHSTCAQ